MYHSFIIIGTNLIGDCLIKLHSSNRTQKLFQQHSIIASTLKQCEKQLSKCTTNIKQLGPVIN